MNKKLSVVLVVILLSLVALPVLGVGNPMVVIDEFGVAQSVNQTGIGSNVGSVTDPGPTYTVLGEQRDVSVQVLAVGGGSVGKVDINANSTNKLSLSNDDGVTSLVKVIWDGSTDTLGAGVVDVPGFASPVDLTSGGAISQLVLAVLSTDVTLATTPVTATVTVYDTTSGMSTLSLQLPAQTSAETPTALRYAFADFTGNVNWQTISAVQLTIDTSFAPSADLSLDWFLAGGFDYGDLPDASSSPYTNSFPTTIADSGAAHFVRDIPNLYFGESVDIEADGQPNVSATGDDLAGVFNDNDGVVLAGDWSLAAGGAVTVTVQGDGCVNGWVDLNQDGDFIWQVIPGVYTWDTNEFVVQSQSQSTGSHKYTFTLSSDPSNQEYYARFRLMPKVNDGCPTPPASFTSPADFDGWDRGMVTNGEVEDYRWDFGPNAVTVAGMTGLGTFGLMGVMAMGMVAAAVVIVRKRK